MGVLSHNVSNLLICTIKVWLLLNTAAMAILILAVLFRVWRKRRIHAHTVIWPEALQLAHHKPAARVSPISRH